MAKSSNSDSTNLGVYPKTLGDASEPFFGLILDEQQRAFRDAIWDERNLIVFVNARAGTGKTLIATATAELLCKYKRYKGIVYIASPTQEQKQGYLKGTLEEKSEPYFEPFYQAIVKVGINPNTAFRNTVSQKNGTDYIECLTHTYLRGTNFEEKVIIIDEAQNYYTDELKKVLTRIHDNCKVIVIGHTGQIDLYKNPERSGFSRYLELFREEANDYSQVCELTKNYRGRISTLADSLD